MLYRILENSRICLTQPTHAWVAGQLAKAWGNELFGAIAPYPEVCLGAEQHDIGWVPWCRVSNSFSVRLKLVFASKSLKRLKELL